jgi:hypothetical protein
MEGQSPSDGDFDVGEAIITYQGLIKQLPPLNRQLLLYILDLLAVFASKADQNKMTTPNLAAIFQPGILSHPTHDMAPPEYRLSQDVLIFLIEHQDHFLIGMQGTAADEKTVQEVESGPPTPKNHSSNMRSPNAATVVRSGSNSSKYSGVRRSASASSRRSRNSVGATSSPIGSEQHTPTGGAVGSGVHRSNTLPPSRSPNLTHGRFGTEKSPGGQTPPVIQEVETNDSEKTARPALSTDSKLHSQPLLNEVMTPAGEHLMSLPRGVTLFDERMSGSGTQDIPLDNASANPVQSVAIPTTTPVPRALEPATPQTTAANGPRPLSSFFAGRSPPSDARKPNKLQKKRSPLPSAHSSTHSLNDPAPEGTSMQSINSSLSGAPLLTPRAENRPVPLDELPLKSPPPIGDSYRANGSPTASNMSVSDAEPLPGQDLLSASYESRDGSNMDAKKRHWFSRKNDGSQQLSIGSNGQAANSRSSVLSSEGGRKSMNIEGRRSVNMERIQSATDQGEGTYGPVSDTDREGRKNPISWIKGKLQDRSEKRDGRDRSKDGKRVVSPARGEIGNVDSQQASTNVGKFTSPTKPPVPVFAGSEKVAGEATPQASTQALYNAEGVVPEKKSASPDTILAAKSQKDIATHPQGSLAAPYPTEGTAYKPPPYPTEGIAQAAEPKTVETTIASGNPTKENTAPPVQTAPQQTHQTLPSATTTTQPHVPNPTL